MIRKREFQSYNPCVKLTRSFFSPERYLCIWHHCPYIGKGRKLFSNCCRNTILPQYKQGRWSITAQISRENIRNPISALWDWCVACCGPLAEKITSLHEEKHRVIFIKKGEDSWVPSIHLFCSNCPIPTGGSQEVVLELSYLTPSKVCSSWVSGGKMHKMAALTVLCI